MCFCTSVTNTFMCFLHLCKQCTNAFFELGVMSGPWPSALVVPQGPGIALGPCQARLQGASIPLREPLGGRWPAKVRFSAGPSTFAGMPLSGLPVATSRTAACTAVRLGSIHFEYFAGAVHAGSRHSGNSQTGFNFALIYFLFISWSQRV